eukprot:6456439-Amphidinium_carterae.2
MPLTTTNTNRTTTAVLGPQPMGSQRKRQPTLDSVPFHIYIYSFFTLHHDDDALLQPERNLVRPILASSTYTRTPAFNNQLRLQDVQSQTLHYDFINYQTDHYATSTLRTTTTYFHLAEHMIQHHSQCW